MNNFQKMLNKHRDHEAKGIKNVNCDDGVTLNRIPFAYATTLSLIPWFQLVCSPGGGGGFSGSHLTFWSTKAWLSVQNNKISLRFPSVKWGPSVRNQNTVRINVVGEYVWKGQAPASPLIAAVSTFGLTSVYYFISTEVMLARWDLITGQEKQRGGWELPRADNKAELEVLPRIRRCQRLQMWNKRGSRSVFQGLRLCMWRWCLQSKCGANNISSDHSVMQQWRSRLQ